MVSSCRAKRMGHKNLISKVPKLLDVLESTPLNRKIQCDWFSWLKSHKRKFNILLKSEQILKNVKLNNYISLYFEKKIINHNGSLSLQQVIFLYTL